ncbi:MAG: SpoIID/LytB domain-containing protein [Cyanobacteriota bacterium]|nr:SpoIID/LytB domain-containing protein [Cyanobacteriota bacterium]
MIGPAVNDALVTEARTLLLPLLVVAAAPFAQAARLNPAASTQPMGPLIRVLLLEAPVITVGAAGQEGLRLRDARGRLLLQVDPGQRLRVSRRDKVLTLEPLARGTDPAPIQPLRAVLPVLPPQAPGPLPVPLQDLRLEPVASGDLLVLNQRRYRGSLLLRPQGESLQAINRLPLEPYLMGVVGSEMPDSWPQAALRAQAVASRTYVLQQLRPQAPFDVKATVASQVYKGVEAESTAVRQAVTSTEGKVLLHGQQLINAVFHSSSGGATENSGDLWSRQLPYLVSVPDFDSASPVSRWEKALEPEDLRQSFKEIGGAVAIEPLQTSPTGRLRRAKVIGPGGELVLTGSEMRQRLGLRSTLVQFSFEPADRITPQPQGQSQAAPVVLSFPETSPSLRLMVKGRGYGHGVGMSQWGAYALALRGKSYEDILRHYYKGAVLRRY